MLGGSFLLSTCYEGAIEDDEKSPSSFYLHATADSEKVSLNCYQTTDATNLPVSGPLSTFKSCETEKERIYENVVASYDEITPATANVMCLSDTLSLSCGSFCVSTKTIGAYLSSGNCYLAIPSVIDAITLLVIADGNYNARN